MGEHPGEECTSDWHCTRQARVEIEMPHYWLNALERWMGRHGVTDRDMLMQAMIQALTYVPTSIGAENDRLRAYHEELNRRVEYHAKRYEKNKGQ